MRHKSISLAFVSTLSFLALAIVSAAPAAAQYGPQSPPPPPPPQGGYYAPQPGPGYYPPPPPPGVDRRGFTIGFSIGAGSFSAVPDDDGQREFRLEGAGVELHLGGMVTREMAILFDIWGVGGDVNDYESVFHNIGTVALRYWAMPKLWLQGGVGWSNFSYSIRDCPSNADCSETSETGGAAMVAAGFELVQTRSFALDLSLRLGVGAYDGGSVNQASVQLGFNWY